MNTTTPKNLFDEVVQHLEIEFSDYAFRKPLLEKRINKFGYRQSKEYNFVVLEIKQYFKHKLLYQNSEYSRVIETEPKYTGNCYTYMIVSLLNKKFKSNTLSELQYKLIFVEKFDFNTTIGRNATNYIIFETGKQKLVQKYSPIKKLYGEEHKKDLEELEKKTLTDIEYKVYAEDLRRQMMEGLEERIKKEKEALQGIHKGYNIPEYSLCMKWFDYRYQKKTSDGRCTAPEKSIKCDFESIINSNYTNDDTFLDTAKWVYEKYNLKVVKIRTVDSRVDYQKIVRSRLDARNIKYWDKETKKTSNKGLKAFHYREYYNYDGKERGGWEFGGIKIEVLKEFCMNNNYETLDKNGKRKDKKTITKEYKNYLYGDLANWVFHILE